MEMVEYIQEVPKTVSEKRLQSVTYTGRVPSGATISSCAVAGYDINKQAVDNTVISGTTATLSGGNLIASIFLQAGTAGKRYRVTFTATLSDGSILPDHVLLIVQPDPA